MAHIWRMDSDTKHVEWDVAQCRSRRQRGGETQPCSTCPGNHGTASQLFSGCRRPDPEMIFGNRQCELAERLVRSIAVQPGRRDKSRNRFPDNIL